MTDWNSACVLIYGSPKVPNWKHSNHVKNYNIVEKETVQLIEYLPIYQVFKLSMLDYQYTFLTDINSYNISPREKCYVQK